MNCLIAGAGPGGLVAALALKRQGFSVRVLDRVVEFQSLGGGLAIQSNGLRLFHYLGLLEDLKPHLRLSQRAAMMLWGNRTLSRFDFSGLDIPFPYFGVVLRYELHEFLVRALAKEGIAIELGREVIGAKILDAGAKANIAVEIREPDGTLTQETTRILVGAEGVHSPVRKAMVAAGRLKCHEFRHNEAWLRMVVPVAPKGEGPVEIWGNDGRRVGIIAMPDGKRADGVTVPRTYCFLPVGPRPWSEILASGLEDWKRSWAPYGPDVMEILDAVENWHEVNHSAFHEIECDRWSVPPIFLLGDAVHGMTPNLGQGANCAMVDGLILAQLLGRFSGQWEQVAAEYHRLRYDFVSTIQKTARLLGRAGTVRLAPLRWLRNMAIQISDRIPGAALKQGRLIAGYNPLEKDLF